MKTRIIKQASIFISSMVLSLNVFSQAHVTMSVKNITATQHTIEYDLYIVNDGSTELKLSACSYGVNFNPAILNNGEIQYVYLPNSRGAELSGLKHFSLASKNTNSMNQARMITTPTSFENAPDLLQHKPFKVGHFVLKNSVEWTANSRPEFILQEQSKIGLTTTQIVAYVNNKPTLVALTPTNKSVATVVDESPLLNPIATNEHISNTSTASAQSSIHHGLINDANIKLFPNPTSDQLKLELNSDATDMLRIKITDFHGRIVKQIQTSISSGLNQIHIDVSELANGHYTLQMRDTNKLNYTQSFTKQ